MKYDAVNMDAELQAAKSQTKRKLGAYDGLIRRLKGPSAEKDGAESDYDPENHGYQWDCNTQAQKVFDNPKWKIKSRRGLAKYAAHAAGLEAAMNRWNEDYDLQGFLTDGPAKDMDYAIGVAIVKPEPYEGQLQYKPEEGEPAMTQPVMPMCDRISPRDLVWDPMASDRGRHGRKPAYIGHRVVWDSDELLEHAEENPDEGWNLDVLRDAVTSLGQSREGQVEKQRAADGLQRNEIVLWELWCPKLKTKDDDGDKPEHLYSGSILTLLDTGYHEVSKGALQFPRKQRRFYGPSRGPYAFFCGKKVPEEFFPLAHLVAIDGQSKELNAISRAVTTAIEAYKRILVTESEELATAIRDQKSFHVHHLKSGVDRNKFLDAQVGGVDAALLAAFQWKQERFQENSGLTEAGQGNSNTGATATADVIANTGAMTRMEAYKRAVYRGATEIGYLLLWYLFHENQIAVFLGSDEQGTEVWVRGGPEDGEDVFDAYDLTIELYSMERTSEATAQRQMLFLTQVLPALAPVMPMSPFIKWTEVFSRVGDVLNMPDLASLIDPKALAAMTGLAIQQQQAGTEGVQAGRESPTLTAKPTGTVSEAPKSPPTPTPGAGGAKPAKPKPMGAAA